MKLSATNAVDYLRSRGHLDPHEPATACALSGGVSNIVVHVARRSGDDLVLKQSCAQLNVAEPWFCSIDRIWREVEILRQCERLIKNGKLDCPLAVVVPKFLFEDRDNHLYAMSAAPADHIVWKSELLEGKTRPEVARSCGALLGALHAGSWHDDSLARRLEDRTYFDELRLDPYYRQVSRVHPDLAAPVERLLASVWNERHSLVHGDFSPKNLLVAGNCITLIDFEVGHYGDPAFDLGFFLSHLMLKAFYHAPRHDEVLDLIDEFWQAYLAAMAHLPTGEIHSLVTRSILNFAGCALARLDGKSKIDYLDDERRRDAVRSMCRTIFEQPPQQWDEVRILAFRQLNAIRCEPRTNSQAP
jgi:5-methylthioribose kinase